VALLRPQRGERHPLRVSRPEVRDRRAMRRRAVGAAGLQAHGDQGLSLHRARRNGLGLAGTEGQGTRAPRRRVVQSAAKPRLRLEAAAGVQLSPGHGRRHRYQPRVLRAPLRGGRGPDARGHQANEYIKADGNVIFEIESAPFGLTLYGRRNGEPDSYYWRVTPWLFSWFTLIPPFGDHSLGGHVWVPIDDHQCWAWSINFRPDRPLSEEERRHMQEGKGIHCPYVPGTFRPLANKDNDYLVDRRAQKEKRAYSGVFGIAMQD